MESLLKSTHNTRDLGGYPCAGGSATSEMILLRSDAPKNIAPEDIRFLLSHNITTVIDLRTTEAPGYQRTLEENGFRYVPCRIAAGSSVPHSVEEVPFSYLAIAESPGMADALRTIAEAEAGVLYHCSAGKDRTGVLSAILLLHAGVDEETVIRDYALTQVYGKEILEAVFRLFPDADRSIVTPLPRHMSAFLQIFREKYQNTENYMRQTGLTSTQTAALRTKLVQSND